ncbi:MAG: GNAT family N-acetyltransferase [Rudaea sp.]|nr:GNAT family N-acetyltransferase [Rudaea sp.]
MNTLAKTSPRTYPNIDTHKVDSVPAATGEHVMTRDGRKLVLRRIRADDVAALQRGFAHLSPEEVRMRFLHPMAELPRDLAVSLCDLDPRYAVAWVLADPDGAPDAEIHAVARAYLDPVTEQAEFAPVVQQDISGQGFGTLLMKRVIDDMRRLGATELWGDILLDNAAMLSLCDTLGFEHTQVPHNAGVQRVILSL